VLELFDFSGESCPSKFNEKPFSNPLIMYSRCW